MKKLRILSIVFVLSISLMLTQIVNAATLAGSYNVHGKIKIKAAGKKINNSFQDYFQFNENGSFVDSSDIHGTWTQNGRNIKLKYKKKEVKVMMESLLCNYGICNSKIRVKNAQITGKVKGSKISGNIYVELRVKASGKLFTAVANGNFSGSKSSYRQEEANFMQSFLHEIIKADLIN